MINLILKLLSKIFRIFKNHSVKKYNEQNTTHLNIDRRGNTALQNHVWSPSQLYLSCFVDVFITTPREDGQACLCGVVWEVGS